MSDFFRNPNVQSVLVEKVPCVFAKPNKDGSIGRHYTMVITSKTGHIMHVGSECEQKHGDAIEFFQSEGGTTCYHVTDAFRRLLSAAKESKVSLPYYSSTIITPLNFPESLKGLFTKSWELIRSTHNDRISYPKEWDLKTEAMQKLVNKFAGHLMNVGKPRVERSGTCIKGTGPTLFTVRKNVYSDSHILSPAYSALEFAKRKYDGSWEMYEQNIKDYAKVAHCFKDKHSISSTCSFCGGTYKRMSKHTYGAKHIARAVEIVSLLCKATTPTGLKMINNPKHKSAFFR